MSLNHIQDNESHARKKVQSLIRGWLTDLESLPTWIMIPEEDRKEIRRSVIRIGWGAYKIGLLTPFDPEESLDAESN